MNPSFFFQVIALNRPTSFHSRLSQGEHIFQEINEFEIPPPLNLRKYLGKINGFKLEIDKLLMNNIK